MFFPIGFFPIGLLWVAVSRENRSAQDLALRTSVIYDWQLWNGRAGTSVRIYTAQPRAPPG
jgi:hypothetical protein